eukprot:scaffold7161_cov133-Cylindrotheca_fusiformis.AAC.1
MIGYIVALASLLPLAAGQCIDDNDINTQFALLFSNGTSELYEVPEGSCCQETICGLPCPEEVSDPTKGFGIVVMCFIAITVLVGFATVLCVKGKSENYFVAGRTLPLWVVTATLASQSLDSNAILGNVDLSYKYHFFDGAVLPIGLGLSLFLNAIFLAKHINHDGALTLPDVYARRYGKVVEVMVAICTITSFLCLLGGNLVGLGTVINYLLDFGQHEAIWLSAALVLLYTIAGGLFSVAYTDVMQACVGWLGSISFAFYMIHNSDPAAPPPSIGFPSYSYPNDEICAMYDGVNCTYLEGACCYNEAKWCPGGIGSDNCTMDNGAYPLGDERVIPAEMSDPQGLTPFPNAILFNWVNMFVLAFGNLAALDFQARCMASKTGKIAMQGCFIAGTLTFIVGIPFSYIGSITRYYYGPDSPRASFATDTCSDILGLPTCGQWLPDNEAFIKLLTHEAPSFLGGWCLVAIVAASMSTCDGAILAMGTVFSHNILRNFGTFISDDNLLTIARFASVPLTAISATIAAYYQSSHALGATGYLLIVAFDVVLASVVVPLFGCFYCKKPSPLAAFCSILAGVITRIVLEFALPKDGYLIAPYDGDEFLNYGPAASSAVPPFWDYPEKDRWDQDEEPCVQERYRDYSGVDSVAAPVACLIVFLLIQFLERNGPLINFAEDGPFAGYLKEGQGLDLNEDGEKSGLDISKTAREDGPQPEAPKDGESAELNAPKEESTEA